MGKANHWKLYDPSFDWDHNDKMNTLFDWSKERLLNSNDSVYMAVKYSVNRLLGIYNGNLKRDFYGDRESLKEEMQRNKQTFKKVSPIVEIALYKDQDVMKRLSERMKRASSEKTFGQMREDINSQFIKSVLSHFLRVFRREISSQYEEPQISIGKFKTQIFMKHLVTGKTVEIMIMWKSQDILGAAIFRKGGHSQEDWDVEKMTPQKVCDEIIDLLWETEEP